MSLAEATWQRLQISFQSFDFGEPVVTGSETTYSGTRDGGAVSLELTERDGVAERLVITDTSADGLGAIDDMATVTTILAPEAQDWLFEQLQAAFENPGTPLDESSDFEFVTLEVSAFTDERGAVELTITDR